MDNCALNRLTETQLLYKTSYHSYTEFLLLMNYFAKLVRAARRITLLHECAETPQLVNSHTCTEDAADAPIPKLCEIFIAISCLFMEGVCSISAV